jgi:hypothetical protein
MSQATLLRMTYRLLLRVHPRSFRDRFGSEMLWIFDEQRKTQPPTRLLIDGAISAIRQHARNEDDATLVSPAFGAEVPTGMSPRRFVQAGVIASAFAYGLILLLARNSPAATRIHPKPHACMPVYSPTHIPYPPKPPMNIAHR